MFVQADQKLRSIILISLTSADSYIVSFLTELRLNLCK